MTRLVEIARYFDAEEAYCVRAFLEARGHWVFLQNEHHLTVQPWLRHALGGYGLWTVSDDADTIREHLKNVAPLEYDEDGNRLPTDKLPRGLYWSWLPIAVAFKSPFLPRDRTHRDGLILRSGTVFMYALLIYCILMGGWAVYWGP